MSGRDSVFGDCALQSDLFFDVVFGSVALLVGLLALSIFGGFVWLVVTLVDLGPEGVAELLGRAVKAFHEAAR